VIGNREFYTRCVEKFPLALNYCKQIEKKGFNKVIQDNFPRTVYNRLGTFSNGESVYRLAEVL